jgi:hypothetical protein
MNKESLMLLKCLEECYPGKFEIKKRAKGFTGFLNNT